MPHSAVNLQRRNQAKQLRRTMTRAETLLWRYLKADHLEDLSFRRQAPMGPYIVDFVCHATRLVVEVDGESHDFPERLRVDQTRDAWLASRGYRTLRFTNDEVLKNLEGVLTVIRETANGGVHDAPPSLSLPRKGGGNPQTTPARVARLPAKRARGVRP
jgi:very-short-patch-repair endonuclease